MAMYIKDNGKMTNRMGQVHIYIMMVQNTKANGLTISNKVMELNYGQMELAMKENINEEKKMVMEYLSGKMDHNMLDNLLIIIFMDEEHINGQTVDYILDNGN